jgi:hypothetical protein
LGIQRRSRFGFPPPVPPSSQHTVRAVPLSQGMGPYPWPARAPGSAGSMTNYLPLDGKIVPRSRISSLNTIRSMLTINGIRPRIEVNGNSDTLWISDRTRHGVIQSNGSISIASFTSAFGLGVAGLPTANNRWEYATTYYPGDADDNVLVAAPGLGSWNTLTITYFAGSNFRTSYLTSAPKAQCVGTFDNYVVAWSIDGGTIFPTRIQWCQRGDPSNWTGEGSGFEDLLEMKGRGCRVMGTNDNRLLLFSTHEIWYGLPATYPAQFQFYPLDRGLGTSAPNTIQETDIGVLFLGSDLNLRLLPRGGGPSQIFAPQLREAIQGVSSAMGSVAYTTSWAVFDPLQRLYYLYVNQTVDSSFNAFVLNIDTGEWGRLTYPTNTDPRVGCGFVAPVSSNINSTMFYGSSTGTVYSNNTKISVEDGSTVQSVWESPPLATDLHGAYKTITNVHLDYRSSSTGTVNVQVSQDNGAGFLNGSTVTLATAAIRGQRAEAQMYAGSAIPMIRLTSANTNYELHRMDVQMVIGGRP